jgi:hypothetical protein
MSQSYDDAWRQSLDGHESPFDADAFWSRLEPKLPPPGRRRRPLFWWWPGALSAFLVLVLSTAALLHFKGGYPQPTSLHTASDDPNHSEHLLTANMADPVTHTAAIRASSLREHVAVQRPFATAKPFHLLHTGHTLSTHPGPGETRLAASPPDINPGPKEASAMRVEQAGTVYSDDEPNSDAEAIPRVPPAPLPGLPVSNLHQQLSPSGDEPTMPTVQTRNIRKGWQVFVDVLSGPGYPSREMSAMEEAYAAHIMQRRGNEQPLESWSLGADIRLYAPSGVFIQVGLRRHQINERLAYREITSNYTWGLATGELLHPDGSTTPWQDSTWVRQFSETHRRHLNRIVTWDLPLAIGYRHMWGPWSGDIAAGVQTNLRQFAEGRSLDPEGRIVTWNETPDYSYRHQVGVSAILQGRLVWYPRTGYGLFVQPTWFLSPSSRTDAAMTGYEIRYHQLFVQTGLSMRFF